MNNAEMIGWVIIALGTIITLFISVSKPLRDNTKAMTENTEQIKTLTRDQTNYENKNHKSHERIWEHEEKQDNIIKEHETRLHDLDGK